MASGRCCRTIIYDGGRNQREITRKRWTLSYPGVDLALKLNNTYEIIKINNSLIWNQPVKQIYEQIDSCLRDALLNLTELWPCCCAALGELVSWLQDSTVERVGSRLGSYGSDIFNKSSSNTSEGAAYPACYYSCSLKREVIALLWIN